MNEIALLRAYGMDPETVTSSETALGDRPLPGPALWTPESRTCRICGCTDLEACPGGCWWVDDPWGAGDLCSTCAVDDDTWGET